MGVTEFATKVFDDKGFMLELFRQIPDEVFGDNAQPSEDEQGQLGKKIGHFCWYGAKAMGVDFTEDELVAECDRKFAALTGLGKIKFTAGIFKTLSEAKSNLKKK